MLTSERTETVFMLLQLVHVYVCIINGITNHPFHVINNVTSGNGHSHFDALDGANSPLKDAKKLLFMTGGFAVWLDVHQLRLAKKLKLT